MKRIILLWAALLLGSTIHTVQMEPVVAIDKLATQLIQKKAYSSADLPNELYPLHIDLSCENEVEFNHFPASSRRISLHNAFQRFVRIFLILLNNQKMQSTAKTIEVMLINLVQMALQTIKISNITQQSNQQEIAQQILQTDPALKNAFILTISRGSSTYNPMLSCKNTSRCCCEKKPTQIDKTTQAVLKNFALIANYFINILHDPEDSDNVTPNLIGMFEGIVNIGTEVIRSGTLGIDINEQEIADYVHAMNPAAKEELMRVMYRTIHRHYLQ